MTRISAAGWWKTAILSAVLLVSLTAVLLSLGARTINVLPRARASLLQLNNDSMERYACLYGYHIGPHYLVTSVKTPTQVDRAMRSGPRWITEATCPKNALGIAHNHPNRERCYYTYPGTYVLTSDGVSAKMSGLPLNVIVCGDKFVWAT